MMYRASIADMVVPYGTPERSHFRKRLRQRLHRLGRMANSLTLGCDCLGAILYFDGGAGPVRRHAHDRERDLHA